MEVSRSRYPRMRPRGYLPHTRVGHLGRLDATVHPRTYSFLTQTNNQKIQKISKRSVSYTHLTLPTKRIV